MKNNTFSLIIGIIAGIVGIKFLGYLLVPIFLPETVLGKTTPVQIAQEKMDYNITKGLLAGGFDKVTNPPALIVLSAAVALQRQVQAHGENGAQIVEMPDGVPPVTQQDLESSGWIPPFPGKGHWSYYTKDGYTTNIALATIPLHGDFLKPEYRN